MGATLGMKTTRGHGGSRQTSLLAVAVAGAGAYVLLLLVLPFLQPGRNIMTAHPEDYAAGAYGNLVNLSYGAFGLALAAIALTLWPGRSWRAVGPLLLVPAAVLCAALALAPVTVARSGIVVLVGVLGLSSGPLISSIVLRHRFGGAYRLVACLGAAVLVGFVAVATSPDAVGGAVNRGFDALAGLWVFAAALSIRPHAIDPQGPVAMTRGG
jgi:hypothetical protein